MLGLSNSMATLVGMAANVATGALAASRWGYAGLFAATSALYLASCITWNLFMKGQPIALPKGR